MKLKQFQGFLLAVLVALAGCDKSGAGSGSTAPADDAAPFEPKQAQPKLATIKLWLGPEEMITEMAITAEQQQTGMMFRTNMAENEGMIFVFPVTERASFWMKNCTLPLSIAYIDADGAIQEIHDLQPHDTNSVTSAGANIRFALETPQGWFQRHKVHEGMTVRSEHGSLMETFNQKR
jgi:hypothetical protein